MAWPGLKGEISHQRDFKVKVDHNMSMLLYGKRVKLAELSHFLADLGYLQKMFLALKFEPLHQIGQNLQFSKHKIFLTSGKKYDSIEHHLGCKHGAHFTPNGLYQGCRVFDRKPTSVLYLIVFHLHFMLHDIRPP